MQDADVKALAWAVRRELDICLADLSNSSEPEGSGPHLEQVSVRHKLHHAGAQSHLDQLLALMTVVWLQVAEVSGPDGYAYLIGKLLASWSEGGGKQEALNKTLHLILASVLSQQSCRFAVVEGFKQSKLPANQLTQLVTATALKPEQQLALALTLCTSDQAPWSQTGLTFSPRECDHQCGAVSNMQRIFLARAPCPDCLLANATCKVCYYAGISLLSELLTSAQANEVSLSPEQLHLAYTCIKAEALPVSLSDQQLRHLLATVSSSQRSSNSTLLPFADPSANLSFLVEARKLPCVPINPATLGPQQSQADGSTAATSAPSQQLPVEQLKALAKTPVPAFNVKAILKELSALDMGGLAEALREAQPACSHNASTLASILKAFPSAAPPEIAGVFSLVACSSGAAARSAESENDPKKAWDIAALAKALRTTYSSTTWTQVLSNCDNPAFLVPDEEGFRAVHQLWTGVSDGAPFPIDVFIQEPWHNLKGQLSFLQHALTQVGFFPKVYPESMD